MENQKDIVAEKDWAFKVRLVPLFLMGWEAPIPDVMLEFMNTFLIIGTYIYFGNKDKVYVINKQLIVYVFECVRKDMQNNQKDKLVSRYQFRHYRIVDLHLQIFLQINGMQKVQVCHTLLDILPLYMSFTKGRRYNILVIKMLLHQ